MHMLRVLLRLPLVEFTTKELEIENMDQTENNMLIITLECCFAILSFVSYLTDMYNVLYLFRLHSYNNFGADKVVNKSFWTDGLVIFLWSEQSINNVKISQCEILIKLPSLILTIGKYTYARRCFNHPQGYYLK